jgi:hypothetical protein
MTIKIIRFYKFTLITIVVIIFASLVNMQTGELPNIHLFPHVDKAVHFAMYAFLTFVFLWENYVRHKYHLLVNRLFLITAIVLLLGTILELAQAYLTISRSGNIWDGVANTIGFTAGFAMFHITKQNRCLKAWVFSIKK